MRHGPHGDLEADGAIEDIKHHKRSWVLLVVPYIINLLFAFDILQRYGATIKWCWGVMTSAWLLTRHLLLSTSTKLQC